MNRTKLGILMGLGLSSLAGLANGQEVVGQAARQAQAQSVPVADAELKRLQAAADADPSSVKTQLSFARQLFENGKAGESWQRLRNAYELAPEDQGVLFGLRAVMDGYKQQGMLNVGSSEKQVLELFGKPHHTKKMPWGMRHVYGMMAIDFRDGKVYELVKLLGATDALFDASHVVDVDLGDRPWHVGLRQKADGLTTAYLFPEEESIAMWTEMVTIERVLSGSEGKTMNELLATVQEQIKLAQPNAEGGVIESADTTAIFAAVFPAGEGQPARQQIIRIWMAARDLHRMTYTHQGAMPKNEDAEKWLGVVKKAQLKPYNPAVSPTSLVNSPRNQVKKLAEAFRTDFRNAIQFKPTEQALDAIAATAEDQKKLSAYCESIYKELDQARAPARPEQSQILVFGPNLDEMPGGYQSTREHFKAGVKFYGFKYVVPGETSGMSFDGAFEVDGKWYFLPKAHRAFR